MFAVAARFWPLKQGTYTLSSGYGPRWGGLHAGQDFAAKDGTPFYACQAGTVQYIGRADGYGQWIVIDSDDSQGSGCVEYGHMWNASATGLKVGSRVAAGQLIGYVGNNGTSTGPHLHISVWPRGYGGQAKIDPLPWLKNAAHVGAPAPTPAPPKPTPGGKFVGEFPTTHTLLTSADSGKRPMPPQLQVIHTNEGGPYARGKSPGTVPGLLQFCANLRNQASYNTIIGRAGDTGRCNSDNYAPWAAGYTANMRGIHLCALGWSAQPRDEWESYDAQLNAIAANLAHNSVVYGIPLVRVYAADIKNGAKGICGHGDVAAAWRETDHTDPGPYFPYDIVIAKAKAIVNGGTPAGDTDMDQAQSLKLDRLFTEFTQKYASRSRRATDPSLPIDTAVGFILNTDARMHELSLELPERFDALTAAIQNLPSAVAEAVAKTQKGV